MTENKQVAITAASTLKPTGVIGQHLRIVKVTLNKL